MREGGRLLGGILRELIGLVKPGIDLWNIETAAQEKIRAVGATPSFETVDNYGFATCLMVNDEVVHAKPRHYLVQGADLVTIDVGLAWNGWQLDTSDSVIAKRPDDRFVSTGRHALKAAIAMAVPGRRIGHVSHAMQEIIERHGYSAVRQYCGHGVGRTIHEDPQIPCYLDRPIERTPLITEGMTLAIEVMMNEGRWEVVLDPDGWTARTMDGSRSVQLEHTVLVTKTGPEILTMPS